jgi:hypothetical protein
LGGIDVSSEGRKKQAERFFLERFLDASGMAAEIVDDREKPDFVIRYEDRLVGVEVTRMYVAHDKNGSLAQAQESISDRIVFRARQLYEASGAQPAHVSVCFAPRHELRQLRRDAVARSLAALVGDMNLVEWKRLNWRPGAGGLLSGVISFVHALGVPTRDMAHWSVARAGWVAPVTVEALQARIDDKAKRLPGYRNEIPEHWLLIYADGMKPSQLFEVRADFEPGKVVSPFTRTYFYAHPDRAIAKLGSHPPNNRMERTRDG